MFSVMMNDNTGKAVMVIDYGGKQHLAEPGSRIVVNQSDSKEGDTVVANDLLTGKDVSLKVVKSFLGDKIKGLKFKSKSRYTRRYGHRQHLMVLEVIGSIEAKKSKLKTVKKTSIKAKVGSK